MRTLLAAGLAVVLCGCGGRTVNLGGTEADSGAGADGSLGGSSDDGGAPGSEGSAYSKCQGSGLTRDASAGAFDAMSQPASCSNSTECIEPAVCNVPPGAPAGQCGPPCQSDCDCPAWLTCHGGVCAQCSDAFCPVGQSCQPTSAPGPSSCGANMACPLGQYCAFGNFCIPILICAQCSGVSGSCPSCASNNQCAPGEVCVGGSCQACTSDSQCGPTAKCEATHAAVQCGCSTDADCAAGEKCPFGVCTPVGNPSCGWDEGTFADGAAEIRASGANGECAPGQTCIYGVCFACTSFEDCNTFLPGGPPGTLAGGLACIHGVCTSCTSNSQCGGGQACVGGTCGTCVTNGQCGPSGQCTSGYCGCTTDAQCETGQRCGAGVCVEM